MFERHLRLLFAQRDANALRSAEVLSRAAAQGVRVPPMETSYYLGRERLVLTGLAKRQRWRKKLFGLMARNARSATEFYGLPPNRVVELGAQIEF